MTSTDCTYADLPEGLLSALLIGLVAATAITAAGIVMHLAGIGTAALLSVAVWIPSLLAQSYCRSMAFRLRRSDQALLSYPAFAIVQVVQVVQVVEVASSFALYPDGVRSTTAFISARGLAATVGAVVGIRLPGARPTACVGVAHLRSLRSRSRWLVTEFGAAYFRAGMGLIGPVIVAFIAGGNVGLPESVRRLREGGSLGLRSYARSLTGGRPGRHGALLRARGPLLRDAPAPRVRIEFELAATVTRLIALQHILMAVSFGVGQVVKTVGCMRQLWVGALPALCSRSWPSWC
ncbi:MAG: hypothetical protein L0H64_12710 [Pseudonocardia sp.]|nr:hypothetical protein [Pseudonocardia sp.]